MTVASFKADWLFAMKYAERLFSENRWSRSTYACLKASFLLMTEDSSTCDHVAYLMRYVAALLTLFPQSVFAENFMFADCCAQLHVNVFYSLVLCSFKA